MNYLVEKVSEYMQQNHMVEEGQKIVVGVSGGADSMGLLFVLSELAVLCGTGMQGTENPVLQLSCGSETLRKERGYVRGGGRTLLPVSVL